MPPPPDKIKDADVRKISSQAMVKAADEEAGWDPSSINKKAKKRRRLWERQAIANADVVIGTLEMACDLQTEALGQ